ncbi:DUF4442 domain-containing protein [Zobellella endophytica]|uniref:DUF4442 domain-containing protein n=1 Tax=Zobellella endophytica TaxID=2116700 RepID=A0A2P7RD30_9GAMM|nr:DUF4442 domain-containing protein [Zobellella endophytica]PSJ48144.1 DUF4442 domain-containing protein [Zobellella endophytica]
MKLVFSRPWLLRRLLNCWPPFWGAGIRIEHISGDYSHCRVGLVLRWWNKNANRTQYGGSLFSMTDPIYAMLLMAVLGPQYYVWDRAAKITFLKPGRGRVYADIYLSRERLDEIRRATDNGDKYFPHFRINILDASGELIAEVERTLYVRKKPANKR